MWKIVICDDEPAMAMGLKKLFAKNFPKMFDNIEIYKDGGNLLEDIEEGRLNADIMFLDIQIGEYNGIELSGRILQKKPTTQIVFMSGYDDYYQAVYEVEHIYFLKKPIDESAFIRAVIKAEEKLNRIKKDSLCVANKGRITLVPFDNICYIEKDRRKVIINTQTGEKYSMYSKMSDLQEKLGSGFERCHNSFIINFEKVRKLEKDVFTMSDGEEIPMSRTYFHTVRERFIRYIDENYTR